MRVILDTNVLVAALITRGTPPDQLYEAWRDGRFTLITSDLQIEELRARNPAPGRKIPDPSGRGRPDGE